MQVVCIYAARSAKRGDASLLPSPSFMVNAMTRVCCLQHIDLPVLQLQVELLLAWWSLKLQLLELLFNTYTAISTTCTGERH
ncbi:unnamed protein product [Musa acuminata var. zebrina]